MLHRLTCMNICPGVSLGARREFTGKNATFWIIQHGYAATDADAWSKFCKILDAGKGKKRARA